MYLTNQTQFLINNYFELKSYNTIHCDNDCDIFIIDR